MVGYFRYSGHWGRLRLRSHMVLGMEVLEAVLPLRPEDSRSARRRARAAELLERRGCRRLLCPCPEAPALNVVHTRSLWQSVAGPLAVAALAAQGLVPGRSVVGIEAQRTSRSLLRCCQYLSTRVRALALFGGAEGLLSWELERSYGLPLADGGEQVFLSFLPGISSPGRFYLGGDSPQVPGFTLALPGVEPPAGCPVLPLFAALLEQGRLPVSQLLILPD